MATVPRRPGFSDSEQDKSYKSTVAEILNEAKPRTILDAPAGSGWLRPLLNFKVEIDGIDLFGLKPISYRTFMNADLDAGIPDELPVYDAIVCCEGIEHIVNPGLLLTSARQHLAQNGLIVITTPNIWYPAAKLQYFLRGFFPSFPCLVGRIQRGSHMHIMPWSFAQLFLFLRFHGYSNIHLHEINEKKPKHLFEKILGQPQKLYCRSKLKNAQTPEERTFWTFAGSMQSIYGRRLVVTARYL